MKEKRKHSVDQEKLRKRVQSPMVIRSFREILKPVYEKKKPTFSQDKTSEMWDLKQDFS